MLIRLIAVGLQNSQAAMVPKVDIWYFDILNLVPSADTTVFRVHRSRGVALWGSLVLSFDSVVE